MNQMNLFEPAKLAGVLMNNRILRAATDEGMADANGNPTERLIKLYENLAKGGVGGMITGYMGISKEGESQMPGMVMIDSDERIMPLSKVVERVHQLNTPIVAQIAHCGRNGVAGKRFLVNKISEETIQKVIEDFTAATVRAYKAGYDAVELHLAHGYFLSEMVSPHTNKRKDKWGGTTDNRMRIVKEIMMRIRKELPNYPIFVKINGSEDYKDGIHEEELVRMGKILEEIGVRAIEVSCGIDWKAMGPSKGTVPTDMILSKYPGISTLPSPLKAIMKPILPKMMKETEATKKYNVPAAKKLKENVQIPVIVVGGIHDLADVESTILEDGIDFVSMSRPLILEPGLVNKFKKQKAQKAKCLSCNYCLIGLYNDSLRCYYGKCPKQ